MCGGQSSIIRLIEDNINNLVDVQENVNNSIDNLSEDNYLETVEKVKKSLKDEKDLLSALINNLNRLFCCGRFNKFRLTEDTMIRDRYYIHTPFRLNKASREYQLLKPVLIDLHKHHFLCDGGIGYAFSSVESHMWEIPSFVKDNELVRKLKKEI